MSERIPCNHMECCTAEDADRYSASQVDIAMVFSYVDCHMI